MKKEKKVRIKKKNEQKSSVQSPSQSKTQHPKKITVGGKLKNAYLKQKNGLVKEYQQKQKSIVANKFVTRKLKYEKSLALYQLHYHYYEDKVDLQNFFFTKFWVMMTFAISNFFYHNHLQLTNYWYLRFVNKRKQFTVSMVGDIWWKKFLNNLGRAVFLTIMGIIVLFPFYWMISISFRTPTEIQDGITGPLPFWPKEWSWGAFDFLFNNPNPALDVSIKKAIGISFLVAFVSVICQTSASLLAGFGLSHIKSRANEAFILILLATMMLPSEALLMGQYLLATKINMKDTFPALFIPFIGNAFTIYMFINAFNGINDSVKRAAKIDGLSNFKFFFKVAIPLISSTIFTAMLISLIASWNAVLWPQMIIQNEKGYYTIPMILWQIINSTGDPNSAWAYGNLVDPQNLKMAASVVSILPMFVIFIFTKKYLVKGITKSSGSKE